MSKEDEVRELAEKLLDVPMEFVRCEGGESNYMLTVETAEALARVVLEERVKQQETPDGYIWSYIPIIQDGVLRKIWIDMKQKEETK